MKYLPGKKTMIFIIIIIIVDNLAQRHDKNVRKETDLKVAQIIEDKIDKNTVKTISLSREMGSWGLTFNAKLQLDNEKVSLIKGFAEGSNGANITIAGNPIGFGISSPKFWLEKNNINGQQVYDVRVDFKRARLLVFNESVTYLVGRYKPTIVIKP
jgi:hypothetical protein